MLVRILLPTPRLLSVREAGLRLGHQTVPGIGLSAWATSFHLVEQSLPS